MQNLVQEYYEKLSELIKRINLEESQNLQQAAVILADAIITKKRIFAFGTGHSTFAAQDLAYRAGGLIVFNPIMGPGLSAFDQHPVTMSSHFERLEGYARVLLDNTPIQAEDVLIVISVSGRNAVPIEMAKLAQERGVHVIAVTSRAYAPAVKSRHASGKMLPDYAEVVLDNKAPVGDALLEANNMPQKFCAASSVTSNAVLQMLVAATIEVMIARGFQPPILMSSNLEGGDDYNARLIQEYRDRIFYI